jgi:hypothetical protein
MFKSIDKIICPWCGNQSKEIFEEYKSSSLNILCCTFCSREFEIVLNKGSWIVEKIIKSNKEIKYKELMLDFLKKKNLIVIEETGISLYTEKDYEEVEKWSENFCKEFFIRIKDHIYRKESQEILFGRLADNHICPWCSLKGYTNTCSYGERHGSCYKGCVNHRLRNNPYYKILKNFPSIISLSRIKDLIKGFFIKNNLLSM